MDSIYWIQYTEYNILDTIFGMQGAGYRVLNVVTKFRVLNRGN
jgi:hypothetical protein